MIAHLARIVALAIAMLAGALPAVAQVRGEVIDWGITTSQREPDQATPDPGEVGLAPARKVSDLRYVERTDTIEARLCRGFGFTVMLSAPDGTGLPDHVEGRIQHPTMTRPDGVTGTEARARSEVIDDTAYVGFSFDHGWEMVAGDWTLSIVVRGAEVARRTFTILAPRHGSPNSECVPDITT